VRRPLLAVLATAAVLLAGCGVTSGRVTGKGYRAADSYTCQIGTMPIGSGSTASSMPLYGTCTDPACSWLTLHNDHDNADGSLCVDPQVWQRIPVGAQYPPGTST
jgi:hypothetical protein